MKMNRDQIVAGGVAVAAFICSAQHIYEVALAAGNPWFIALVHPVGLDGLIYIGMRAVSNGRKWQGWLATVYGVGMSLAFNAVSYAGVDMPPAAMAVAMPLALVLGVLVVGHGKPADVHPPVDMGQDIGQDMSTPKPRRVRRVPAVDVHPLMEAPVAAVSAVQDIVSPVVSTPEPGVPVDDKKAKALRMLDEGRTRADVAAAVGVSTKTIQRWSQAK